MAQLSQCTTAIEPVPSSRGTATTEPTRPGACALQQGELPQLKPAQCNKEQSPLLTFLEKAEKSPCRNEGSAQPKVSICFN